METPPRDLAHEDEHSEEFIPLNNTEAAPVSPQYQPGSAPASPRYCPGPRVTSDDEDPEEDPSEDEEDEGEPSKLAPSDPSSSRGHKRKLEERDATTDPEGFPISRDLDDRSDWGWYPDRIRTWLESERVPPPPTWGADPKSSTLPPLRCSLEQAFAAHVAAVDRELYNASRMCGALSGIQQNEQTMHQQIKELARELQVTDTFHSRLVDMHRGLESQMATFKTQLEAMAMNVTMANARAAAAEADAAAARLRADAAEAQAEQALAMVVAAHGEEEEVEEEEDNPVEEPADGESDAESAVLTDEDI